jgi:uncharacterized Zn-binding protein involved in type VI secretion
MPPQCRLGHKSKIQADAHGCPACPHTCIGPATTGSPDVNVNSQPALRVTDMGVHAACCSPVQIWTATKGSSVVMINGLPAHRKGDMDTHCGGIGAMDEGSGDVECG